MYWPLHHMLALALYIQFVTAVSLAKLLKYADSAAKFYLLHLVFYAFIFIRIDVLGEVNWM